MALAWALLPNKTRTTYVEMFTALRDAFVTDFGDVGPVRTWSHYDNVGPRTTNVAEGFHNGLNSRFGMSHPSLRLFLDWLQKYQFEVQCRGLQLASGRPPKQRPSAYVKLDENLLWAAKLSYSIDYGRINCDFAFNVPAGLPYFRTVTEQYLSRVSYLLGCH